MNKYTHALFCVANVLILLAGGMEMAFGATLNHACYGAPEQKLAEKMAKAPTVVAYLQKDGAEALIARAEICRQIESKGRVVNGDIFFGIDFPNEVAVEIRQQGLDLFSVFAAMVDRHEAAVQNKSK